jgi:hypothetical protein
VFDLFKLGDENMDNLSFNTLLPEDFDEEGGEEFSFSLNFLALLGVDIEEGLFSSTSFNLHRLLGVSFILE